MTKTACIGDICTYTEGICTGVTCTKDTDIKDACIKGIYLRGASIGVICVGGTYAGNTYTKSTYAKNAFSVVGVYIKGNSPESTCTKSADRKSACTEGTGAIQHSRIYLQFILISEVKLFNMG